MNAGFLGRTHFMKIYDLIDKAIEENDLKIISEQMQRLLAEDTVGAVPFVPALTLSKEAIQDLELENQEELRGLDNDGLRSLAMRLANRLAKAERRIAYQIKTGFGFDGTIIFSEGDSWFQYPLLLTDIIDHLSDDQDKAILSFGEAGDLLSNIAERQEYIDDLDQSKPDIFLLSGAGNDFFAPGIFDGLLNAYQEGFDVDDILIGGAYRSLLAAVEADYRHIVEGILTRIPEVGIFGHAYDVPCLQGDGPWIGAPFKEKKIPDQLGARIVARILDDFSGILREIEKDYDNYTFLDLRNVVGSSANSWYDEIHPKSAGFGRVANVFREAIESFLSARIPVRTASAETFSERETGPEAHEAVSILLQQATAEGRTGQEMSEPASSSFALRKRMAREIITYEARYDAQGRIAVHKLAADDGGGAYEVAGINERYHKSEADHLVGLIRAGRHEAAEDYAAEFIAGYTDRADRWCTLPAIEFYLRDCVFNRGPGGAAWIVQHAVDVTTDQVVGPITRGAIRKAELSDPISLLHALRASREVYERRKRDETSRYWRGLVNRWNKALAFALSLLDETVAMSTSSHGLLAASIQTPTPVADVKRVLNCNESKDPNKSDWTIDDARAADILRSSFYPDRVDLREDWWTIGDQRETGSCVGWATADSILRWHFVKAGRISREEMLSPRFIWMAAKETDEFRSRPTSFIEEAGTSLKAALDVARKLGCVPDHMLPFEGSDNYDGRERSFYARASRLKIANYHNLGRNPEDWRLWLYQNGPILTRLNLDRAFYNASSTYGRLTDYDANARGGHAIALVGYSPEGFIVRNSWSEMWGDRGFALATNDYAKKAFTETYGIQVF